VVLSGTRWWQVVLTVAAVLAGGATWCWNFWHIWMSLLVKSSFLQNKIWCKSRPLVNLISKATWAFLS